MGRLEEVRDQLAAKFAVLFPHLDERQRRLLMGAGAQILGMAGSGPSRGRPGRARPRSARAWTNWQRATRHWARSAAPAAVARRPPRWIRAAVGAAGALALVEPEERGDP